MTGPTQVSGGRGSRAVRLVRSAGGAVVAQFLNAGGSLIFQVIGARTLGGTGFGAFALVISVITTVTAPYTGWVGDALTVLDRFDRRIRGGISASLIAWIAVSAVGSFALGPLLLSTHKGAGVPIRTSLTFGALVGLWLLEETGRRIFLARRRFWGLAANDLVYNLAALATLGALLASGAHVSLQLLILSMASGSAVATVAGLLVLPRAEIRLARPDLDGFREVASFGFWRAMHAGIRPLSLLVMRVIVRAVFGLATVGALEAGRLLLAPAIIVVNGAGSFLLPLYSHDARSSGRRSVKVNLAVGLLLGATAATGLVAVALTGVLAEPLTGGDFPLDRLTVLGWAVYALSIAATVPVGMAAVAQRLTKQVFQARMVDATIGLLLVGGLCLMSTPKLIPYALSVGGFFGAWLLQGIVRRADAGGQPRGGASKGGTHRRPAGGRRRLVTTGISAPR